MKLIFLFAVFLLAGVFMLALPHTFWMITEQWKSDDATGPSTIFTVSTRFGGAVLVILGILGFVFVR